MVKEEQRQRSEDQPVGYLRAFPAAAFQKHLYGRPLIGSMEEIAITGRRPHGNSDDALPPQPANLVLVGDIDLERTKDLLSGILGSSP